MTLAPPTGPVLRDIHVPQASWWPLAPGWWILLAVVLLLLGVVVWLLRKHIRRKHRLRSLDAELSIVEAQFEHDENKANLASGLSELIRRAAVLRGGNAQLTGQAWLAELERLASGCLQEQDVTILESAPYQRQCEFDAQALTRNCRQWLRIAVVDHDA